MTKTTEREKPSTKGPSFVEKAKERIADVTEKICKFLLLTCAKIPSRKN